jgi:hypothetical protein
MLVVPALYLRFGAIGPLLKQAGARQRAVTDAVSPT